MSELGYYDHNHAGHAQSQYHPVQLNLNKPFYLQVTYQIIGKSRKHKITKHEGQEIGSNHNHTVQFIQRTFKSPCRRIR